MSEIQKQYSNSNTLNEYKKNNSSNILNIAELTEEIEELNTLLSLEFIRKKKITKERLIAAFGPSDSDEPARPANAYRQYRPKPEAADEDDGDE